MKRLIANFDVIQLYAPKQLINDWVPDDLIALDNFVWIVASENKFRLILLVC